MVSKGKSSKGRRKPESPPLRPKNISEYARRIVAERKPGDRNAKVQR